MLDQPKRPTPLKTRRIQANGTELMFTDNGDGRPIVAVHGAVSDGRVWAGLAPQLPAKYRFIAYSQRYFGTQPWADRGAAFSRDTHIDDLIAFTASLNAGPVTLVTWSYGGDIGTHAMLRRPDLFRAAVHYEPSIGGLLHNTPGGREAQAAFVSSLEPAIEALGSGRIEDAGFLFLEAICGMQPGTGRDEPEPWLSIVRDNARTLPLLLGLEAGAPISEEQLTGITQPVLIVLGEHALPRYRLIGERLRDCLPTASIETLPGVGHDGPYRNAEGFAQMIARFCGKLGETD